VIIYMGMKKLREIADIYIDKGYGDMPAAIIQHASLPNRKIAKGKAKDLFEKVLAGNQWSSFGYIAAEAELAKMK